MGADDELARLYCHAHGLFGGLKAHGPGDELARLFAMLGSCLARITCVAPCSLASMAALPWHRKPVAVDARGLWPTKRE